jgi:hypothetical protein
MNVAEVDLSSDYPKPQGRIMAQRRIRGAYQAPERYIRGKQEDVQWRRRVGSRIDQEAPASFRA